MRGISFFSKPIAVAISLILLSEPVLVNAAQSTVWADRQRHRDASTDSPTQIALAGLPLSFGGAGLLHSETLSSISPMAAVPEFFRRSLLRRPPADVALYNDVLGSLLPSDGTLRDVRWPEKGAPSKVIIHFQDVHRHEEAQNRLSEALRRLIEGKKIGVVGVEGAFRPIELSRFHSFPDQSAVREAADFALKRNEISGPVHSFFVSNGSEPALVGIDDARAYAANVNAYKTAAPMVQERRREVETLQRDVEDRMRVGANTLLIEFINERRSYVEGKEGMGDYLTFLAASQGSVSTDVKNFLQALAIEKSLKLDQVEAERAQVIGRLIPTLDSATMQALMARGSACRVGRMSQEDFYAYLKDVSQRSGLRLSDYPAFNSYLHYLLLSDQIDGNRLFDAVTALEREVGTSLARTPTEKKWLQESAYAGLLGKLIEFSLTSTEWEQYKALPPALTGRMRARLGDLAPFEAFYVEAEKRDALMAQNMLKAPASAGNESDRKRIQAQLLDLKKEFSNSAIAVVPYDNATSMQGVGGNAVDIAKALQWTFDKESLRFGRFIKAIRARKVEMDIYLATRLWRTSGTLRLEGEDIPVSTLLINGRISSLNAINGLLRDIPIQSNFDGALNRLIASENAAGHSA